MSVLRFTDCFNDPLTLDVRQNGQHEETSPERVPAAFRQHSGSKVSPERMPHVARDEGSLKLAEQELRGAILAYQKSSGRMFPTWSEVLEVLQGLGYRKPGEEIVPLESS